MMIKGGFFLEFRFFFLRCKILFMGSIVLYIKCICFSSKIKQIGTKNCNSLSRLARLERFAILPVSSCSRTACICHRQRRHASQLTAAMWLLCTRGALVRVKLKRPKKKPFLLERFFFGATCWTRTNSILRCSVLPHRDHIATAKQSAGLFCLRQFTARMQALRAAYGIA